MRGRAARPVPIIPGAAPSAAPARAYPTFADSEEPHPMQVIRFADLCAQGAVHGKRVFIRADLNVPQDNTGAITEDTRIRASVPCIRMALDAGAAVMVTSHLGRPTEGEFKPADSLAPVARRLGELLGREVPLQQNWVDGVSVQPGQLVLLENCRVNKGEKKCDEALSRKMAALCDISPPWPAPARCWPPRSTPSPRLWRIPGARWWPSWPAAR